jgi:S1-C subfamily serine protease
MKITITCPACSASFLVEPKEQACRAKCAKCGGAMLVPPASEAKPATAPAVARPKAAAPAATAKPTLKPQPKPAPVASSSNPLDALLAMDASAAAQPLPAASWGLASHPVAPAKSSSSNQGLLIGVGVAVGVVFLLLIGGIVMLAMRGGNDKPSVASNPPEQEESKPNTKSTSLPTTAATSSAPVTPTPSPVVATTEAPKVAPPTVAPILEPVSSTPATPPAVASADDSTSDRTARKEPMKMVELVDLIDPAVVRINGMTSEGGVLGSGFVIDMKGTVITNHHVVAGTHDVKVTFENGKEAKVLGCLRADESKDIAIIRIDINGLELKPVSLARVLPRKGEQVVAFGCPIGLGWTTTDGIVSAIREGKELDNYGAKMDAKILQTSTPISSGNSGGPLVNMFGEVVGMNTAALQSGQNLNFSVAVTEIRGELAKIKNAKLVAQMPDAPPKAKRKTDSGVVVKDETPEELLKKPVLPTEFREWKFESGPIRARVAEMTVADAEKRPPSKFNEKDFDKKGRYQMPKRIVVFLETEDKEKKKYTDGLLDPESRKIVHQMWKEHAYYNIKYRIVKKGSDLIEGLAEASSDGDSFSSQINVKNLMLLSILSDITLPTDQSDEVIKLVTGVLEKYSTKTGKRQLTTLLNEIRQRAMGDMGNENAIAGGELLGIFKTTLLGG